MDMCGQEGVHYFVLIIAEYELNWAISSQVDTVDTVDRGFFVVYII